MTTDYSNPIPPRVQSLIGQRFNRLTVIEFSGKSRSGAMWLCRCTCGKETAVLASSLKTGNTQSCGCLWLEAQHNRAKIKTRVERRMYRTWINMRVRCYNPNNKDFHDYGGRGIGVCDRWLNSFDNFYADMGDPPTVKHSIDRVDNNQGYSPDNCRWATSKEQMNNTRRNKPVTINGVTKNLLTWATELGVGKQSLLYRLRTGWTAEDALTIPMGQSRKNSRLVTIDGRTQGIIAWARELGIEKQTLFYRIRRGWSAERALTTPVKPRNMVHPKWKVK